MPYKYSQRKWRQKKKTPKNIITIYNHKEIECERKTGNIFCTICTKSFSYNCKCIGAYMCLDIITASAITTNILKLLLLLLWLFVATISLVLFKSCFQFFSFMLFVFFVIIFLVCLTSVILLNAYVLYTFTQKHMCI